MILSKASKQNIILFAAAFLLCGLLRVLLYAKDFTFSFSSLFCGVLTILWAISVRKRVTDGRLQALMLWITVCLLLQFVLQILRYEMFSGQVTAQRYLWYAMYLPMLAQPLLCFFLAVLIHRPKDKPLPRLYALLIVLGVLLALGFLTNDLHFFAKSFPSGVMDDNGQEKNGWLFSLVNLFIYGLYALTYFVILKKDFRFVGRKYRWLPLLPFLTGVIYFLLYPLDVGHHFFQTRIWQMGEMSAFCIIGTLEACVQVGMIPANMGYETVFSASFIPAVILDQGGLPVYQTAAADYPFAESETTKIMSHAIQGGSIRWTVDMKQVRGLNQQIEEATAQIEARNAYLAEENRIRQERAELETRNRMYDSIIWIVKPQFDQIDALLDGSDGSSEKMVPKIAVISAYIKRRGNMELLSAAGTLTVVELVSAVTESLDYMRLCGVNTAISSVGTGSYPAEMVIAAYEHIEAIVEESLDTLSDFMVSVRSDKRKLIVRMMLKADDFLYESNGAWQDGEGFSRKVSISKNKQDMLIVLTFTEGGGRK